MRKDIHYHTRGSALIVALWITTLFVMLAMSLAFRMNFEAKLTMRENAIQQTNILFYSGIALFDYHLAQDNEPSVDSLYDEWYNQLPVDENVIDEGTLEVTVIDEESKLNLNQASRKHLTLLLEYIDKHIENLNSDVDEIVDAIEELKRDRTGEEMPEGMAATSGDFSSIYELLLHEDIEERDFNVFKRYITVHAQDEAFIKVNLNTVQEPVLYAIIFGLTGSESIKRDFFEGFLSLRPIVGNEGEALEEEKEKVIFSTNDITPYVIIERLGLSSDVLTVSLAMQLMRHLTVDSNYFELTMKATSADQYREQEAIVIIGPIEMMQPGGASGSMRIYSWHEV